MDWTILISVVIGGLIATIPVLISNRFQAIEREKDRQEQRREAKIQVREKWTERDILRIMDLLESVMKLLTEEENLWWSEAMFEEKKELGVLTQKEYKKAVGLALARISERIQELDTTMEQMARLVWSFEEGDMTSSYERFAEAMGAWRDFDKHGPHPHKPNKKRKEGAARLWFDVIKDAGEFHRAMREKLISIRGT